MAVIKQVIQKIADNAAFMLAENNLFCNLMKDQYSKYVGGGTTTDVKLRRGLYSSPSGNGVNATSTNNEQEEGSILLPSNSFHKHQLVKITEENMKFGINDFMKDVVYPAMETLVGEAEVYISEFLGQRAGGIIGTPGVAATTVGILNKVTKRFNLSAIPMSNRVSILDPDLYENMTADLQSKALESVMPEALRKYSTGRLSNLEVLQHHIFYTHLTGNYAGSPLINGSSQAATWSSVKDTYVQNLTTDGWSAASTLKRGDMFTIAGVFAIGTVSKQNLGFLQEFTVVNNPTADGSGNMIIQISPPILPLSGATGTSLNYANVTNAPADNAVITVRSGAANTLYKRSVAFHPEAIAFMTCPLAQPPKEFATSNMVISKTSLKDGMRGMSPMPVTVMTDYDMLTAQSMIRIDLRFGMAVRESRGILAITQ